jgi:poly(3-hydroxybutyrate) depolymerase
MTKDERRAIQPMIDAVNNKHRAFTMAKEDGLYNKRDPYCSCLPNIDVGFNVMFPNEWEVSVRWGKGHSCDGGKTTVEVAVFDPEENWYTLDDDDKLCRFNTDVMGYVTPETLTRILQEVAKQ